FDDLPGHEVAIGRGEERGDAGDVLGLPTPPDRYRALDAVEHIRRDADLLALCAHGREASAGYVAGRDGIHVDAVARPLPRERAREADDARLGRAVVHVGGAAVDAVDGRDVDHLAVMYGGRVAVTSEQRVALAA